MFLDVLEEDRREFVKTLFFTEKAGLSRLLSYQGTEYLILDVLSFSLSFCIPVI